MVIKWQTIKKEFVHDYRIVRSYWHHCHHSQKKIDYDFFVLHSNDWVNVIPLTADHKVVFIRQYRPGVDDITLEIPGGLVEQGEDPLKAGLREMAEETGYHAASFDGMGFVHPNPAMQDNRCHFMLARDCQKKSATKFDRAEDIETELVDLKDVPKLIATQKITHALVLCAFQRMNLLFPEYNLSRIDKT
ncbi:MAG: NUDIX hydrolase [Deltaproteobacteria bacterium]|nr:NUDIX hydrolase [Deltaproteobacteria bacterium]